MIISKLEGSLQYIYSLGKNLTTALRNNLGIWEVKNNGGTWNTLDKTDDINTLTVDVGKLQDGVITASGLKGAGTITNPLDIYDDEQANGISGTTFTFDCALGMSILADLNSATGSINTFVISNPKKGRLYVIRFLQDSSTAISVTFANWTNLKWVDGSETNVSATLSKNSYLTFYYNGTTYDATLSKATL